MIKKAIKEVPSLGYILFHIAYQQVFFLRRSF